jgi:hypothetical protein
MKVISITVATSLAMSQLIIEEKTHEPEHIEQRQYESRLPMTFDNPAYTVTAGVRPVAWLQG